MDKEDEDNSYEKLYKLKNDLMDFKVDPHPEIYEPYNNDEDNANKLSNLYLYLKQNRSRRDRIKSLAYYYWAGRILSSNSQQHLRQLKLSKNQAAKLTLKGTRIYKLFRMVGYHQIYNTDYVSVKAIAELTNDQFNYLVNLVDNSL